LKNKNRVIEIVNYQDGEGANVGVGALKQQLCQKWSIDYVDQAEDRKTTGLYVPYQIHLGRAFIIRSRMPMQRVLTLTGGRNLVIKTHNRQDNNQIFFLDPDTKTLKSVAQNTKSIDIQGSGTSSNLQIWNTNARWFQLFKYDNGAIVNIKDGRAMDVSGNVDRDNQNVIMFKRRNTLNQQWDIVYLDALEAPLKNGEWWADWGMYVGKEFSIVSKMPGARYLDVRENNVVINQRSGKPTQKWTFDYTSRTIINVATKKSLNLYNKTVDVRSTTSEWNQLWRFRGDMVVNVKGKVLHVDDNKDREGQNVGIHVKQGTRNQKWGIIYSDQEDPMKKKTEDEFGFRFGRPFYIVSQMCSGRAIKLSGRNLVLARKTNSSNMHFFFDQKSRTLKSW
jgi:hypothetical protein